MQPPLSGTVHTMILYEVTESARAKNLRITIHPDGRIVVTKPKNVSIAKIQSFVENKRDWIEDTVATFKRSGERAERTVGKAIVLPRLRRGTKAYSEIISTARTIATERVRHVAQKGGFRYSAISIRNQKTRWGSCSARGTLSFNYRIAYLSPELQEYLVVHELAHTKHHNHSARFWALVAEHIPDYLQRRRELQRYRF